MLDGVEVVEEKLSKILQHDARIKEVVQKLVDKELDSCQAITLISSRLSYVYSLNPVPNTPYTEVLLNRLVAYFVMGIQEVIIESQDRKSKQMLILINFLFAMLLLSIVVLF